MNYWRIEEWGVVGGDCIYRGRSGDFDRFFSRSVQSATINQPLLLFHQAEWNQHLLRSRSRELLRSRRPIITTIMDHDDTAQGEWFVCLALRSLLLLLLRLLLRLDDELLLLLCDDEDDFRGLRDLEDRLLDERSVHNQTNQNIIKIH